MSFGRRETRDGGYKMIQPPILIAGPPRSGTTMLAGLLHKHGVWVGNTRTTHFPGTNPPDFGSENLDIKALMQEESKKIPYRNWCVPLPDEVTLASDLKQKIDTIAPDDTPWLVKTSWTLIFYRFWVSAYPGAKWIFPMRKPEMILDSMNRHPSMRRRPDKMKKKFIKALKARQMKVMGFLHEYDFTYLNMNKISKRDNDEIERLFHFMKIEINWEAVNEWIKPKDFKRS